MTRAEIEANADNFIAEVKKELGPEVKISSSYLAAIRSAYLAGYVTGAEHIKSEVTNIIEGFKRRKLQVNHIDKEE